MNVFVCMYFFIQLHTQSAGIVEYTNCIPVEG